ncbi:MAG: AAA-like domain-containing protein [Mojavia pulchra JT2-VF2]|uniref:AAA-like domain-containing protein n=1 Tax=Mojavia pulchra JT2-VF2 TaxID=287848 RepID=A0A951PYW8_9NOST|nr:AAA-like domain-containing protein [Mojavia pulchra JT2-VF2]
MNFTINEALEIANQLTYIRFQRNLTDVEIIILKGAWERQEYDEIAAKNQYATSYISQDVAPRLWKLLTESLGEKVKKSNFKETLKRCWEKQLVSDQSLRVTENIANHQDNTSPTRLNSVNNLVKHEKKIQHLTHQENLQTLTPDIYIDRPPMEYICYESLLQPGSLIRIKAPKLMGKTYLVARVLAEVAQQNYRTVNLSFELAERNIHLTNLNKFLRWFCIYLSRELRIANELDEYWDEEGMGAKVSCTTYFEEYLLVQSNAPLVLCLDDVDLLFPYPHIYEDFFGLLRSWYEKARSRKIWKNLRLIIVHSTDVYIRLNINQSPFNVGLPIELSEFTSEQVFKFAQQHELEINSQMVEQLMELVGGHPYLLEVAFAHLKINPHITLGQLLAEATTEAGIYAHHLREHWLYLHSLPELEEAFKKVVIAKSPVPLEPILAYQLNSMGLINLSSNKVMPRCNLYRQYFQMYWADK